MRTRALLFGAGKNCVNYFDFLSRLYSIVGIADNLSAKQGTELFGLKVGSAAALKQLEYDIVIVTPTKCDEIIEQLILIGVEQSAILTLAKVLANPFHQLRGINVAVMFYGGIGDLLIGLNWLYHLVKRYDLDPRDVMIDAFIEENGPIETKKQVFAPCDIITGVYCEALSPLSLCDSNDYDLVFRFCIVPYVQQFNGEKLAAMYPDLLDYVVELQKFGWHNYCYSFCHSPSFYETVRNVFELLKEKRYHSFCDLFSDLDISEEYLCPFPSALNEEAYLCEMGLGKNRYIAIDATMNHYPNPVKSTRAWPEENWIGLVTLIKAGFPKLKIVQIGTYATDRVDLGADLNLSGETDLDQIKTLLANALLLVDYEGGLVHMRHILHGGPSVVLFGPTSIEQHQYTENINIRADIDCPSCEWTTPTWLNDCPKGYDPPMCMQRISPQMVFGEIKNYISGGVEDE